MPRLVREFIRKGWVYIYETNKRRISYLPDKILVTFAILSVEQWTIISFFIGANEWCNREGFEKRPQNGIRVYVTYLINGIILLERWVVKRFHEKLCAAYWLNDVSKMESSWKFSMQIRSSAPGVNKHLVDYVCVRYNGDAIIVE